MPQVTVKTWLREETEGAVKITHLCPDHGEHQGEGSVPGQASLRTKMEPAAGARDFV